MNQLNRWLIPTIIALLLPYQAQSATKVQLKEHLYLGELAPGATPKMFAPGRVSTEHRDYSGFFSPDMSEFYFTRRMQDTGKWFLVTYKFKEGKWQHTETRPRVWRPLIAPDGQTMHLGRFYMTRTQDGWSEVESLGPMFDRDDWGIMRLTSSADGTYVFDDYKNGDILRISTIKDGKRQPPELLGKHINSGKYTAHPFISPDGSFLIWDSEKDNGFGDSDLYVSFRREDGSWGNAINLGSTINTDGGETGAYVTPDNKYLFFNRHEVDGNGDIYWVDAKEIFDLKTLSLAK